ncbi:Ribulose bisphosphate carboxylase, large subunit, ferrodoxin-like N-terminal [Cynara cardunculus var. scolymus]|uniref:Ribulose bisphosphate carboxylase large chain n=1 Tax=Cynara cardunculus var. scolymus TaxID=59895 RepID=A0A103XRQ3_CYNCS|nr:Ribulose bisphosphate carboxylase, large subunit, ferrodoxin-like N-terminal [Cynara cardunculus var. scolymus]
MLNNSGMPIQKARKQIDQNGNVFGFKALRALRLEDLRIPTAYFIIKGSTESSIYVQSLPEIAPMRLSAHDFQDVVADNGFSHKEGEVTSSRFLGDGVALPPIELEWRSSAMARFGLKASFEIAVDCSPSRLRLRLPSNRAISRFKVQIYLYSNCKPKASGSPFIENGCPKVLLLYDSKKPLRKIKSAVLLKQHEKK